MWWRLAPNARGLCPSGIVIHCEGRDMDWWLPAFDIASIQLEHCIRCHDNIITARSADLCFPLYLDLDGATTTSKHITRLPLNFFISLVGLNWLKCFFLTFVFSDWRYFDILINLVFLFIANATTGRYRRAATLFDGRLLLQQVHHWGLWQRSLEPLDLLKTGLAFDIVERDLTIAAERAFYHAWNSCLKVTC